MLTEANTPAAKTAVATAAVAVGYYILARVGLSLALAGTSSCPLWPAAGLALAGVIAWGPWAGAGVFLGSLLANLQFLQGAPNLPGALACAGIAFGSAAQAVAGARLLGGRLSGPDVLVRSKDVVFFAAAVPLTCVIAATAGVASLLAAGHMTPALAGGAWLTWWIGDVVGALITAPLLFAWRPRANDELGAPPSARRVILIGATAAALFLSVRLGFGETFRYSGTYPLSFLPFTVLIWITMLHDSRGATAGAAALAVFVHWYALRGLGPFAGGSSLTESLLLSSAYLIFSALTAFLVRALLAERQAALAELHLAQKALEHRVSKQDDALFTAHATLRVAALGRREDGQRIQLYRQIVDELPVGIVVLRLEDARDPDSWLIVEMNEAGRRLSGARGEEPQGQRLFEYAPETRGTELPRACAEALNMNRGVEIVDFASTERVPGARFMIKVFPLGAPLVGLVFENVTERVTAQEALNRSQRALEERTAALAHSNAELTQFAYVASHDLQAPLRKAAAFAEQLRIRLGGGLDETSADFMARMGRSLTGMQTLIDALLQLARVATHGAPPREVDLSVVAAEVISDFEEVIARSGARVQVSRLPGVMGDPQQMRQLLQNLIGNALKFRKPGTPSTIRITGRPAPGGGRAFSVEDDGIGFEMSDAQTIFEPFRRLNSVKDYPGTGMGLAICQKIVERHGGRITVDSAPGRGSVFTVVLPDTRATEAAPVCLESATG